MEKCKKRSIAEVIHTTCKQQREGWSFEEKLNDIIIKFFEEKEQ